MELELIDFGLEELGESTGENGEPILVVRCGFTDFGNMQKALEDKGINPTSAELEWIPTVTVPVNDAQAEEISKLIEKLEQDDDVQKVFHNMG
jgi:transcriptional/translational regulatory protein YebC/TACO1